MKSEYIIVHPANHEELKAIKAFLKALKIKFEVVEDTPSNPELVSEVQESKENYKKLGQPGKPAKDDVVKNLKTGLQEVRLFKKDKLKTTSAKDFLNEL